MGKVYIISLGPSQAINLPSLRAAARKLAGKYTHNGSTTPSTPPAPKTAATIGSLSSLMRTKLYRPPSGSDVIFRIRLIERLNAALGGQVILVCAPAGFGKTTLLSQWMQTRDRPTAWLSLDEHDNDLPVFVHSLAAALQTAFPSAAGAHLSIRSTAAACQVAGQGRPERTAWYF